MKDRRLNSKGEIEEWERARTIPDDFIYDPVTHAYYAPGEPTEFDAEAFSQSIREIVEERRNAPPIPPEKLRVPAGTLSDPAKRRKSLGVERGLLFDLSDDEDTPAKEQAVSDDD